ncbi:MAG: immunity 17 family protein [Candidatus Omnitrophica bacterium]|nr:immunity 17 family protein [Candidatus Omnitrophota bacterium]
MNVIPYILIAAGVFSILGAINNWDWFMEHRKARFMVRILTRTGARVFYALLGTVIAAIGICALTGLIDMK